MPNEFLETFLGISLIFIVLLTLVLLIAYYINYQVMKLPNITPERFIRRKRLNLEQKSVVVCVGDSLTHGRISSNYVRMLRERFGPDYEFVNAGVNSNLAWNVLERLPGIIECKPDFITILIGTNDVNATLSRQNMADYIRRMGLPEKPDLEWYKTSLNDIVSLLKNKTSAQIALITLPTIGESPNSKIFHCTNEYSEIIRETAIKHGCDCLPLEKQMIDYLVKNSAHPRFDYEDGMRLTLWAAIQHYGLFRSWDIISKKAGFKLHLDYLHLNTEGAIMIADLIEEFIRKKIS